MAYCLNTKGKSREKTMLTKLQLEERLKYVTGSDAAAICGKSRYNTPVNIWLEKTGRVEQKDISHMPHIRFGSFMESGVADWFEAESGKKVCAPADGMIFSSQYPWMAGNVDRMVVGENAILECKTALRPDDWGDCENKMPDEYLLQVAHYCIVGNFDRAYVAVVFRMTGEFRWYEYQRNPALEEKLIKRERDFWYDNVLADIAPPATCEEDILAMFKTPNETPITATDEIESYVYAYKDFNSQVAGLEEEKKYMRDKIAVFMGDHDTLISEAGEALISWKFTKEVERFDTKLFEVENKELYKRYIKKAQPQRRFVVKTKGE